MIDQQGRWGDLIVGSYMRDKTGKVWKVVAERDFHLQVQDRDGIRAHLTPRLPDSPVTLVVPTETEALETLRDQLGAQAVGVKATDAKDWTVPAFQTSGAGCVSDGKSHMKMYHGVWCDDVKKMQGDSGLLAAHVAYHREPDPDRHVAHVHRGGNPT